MRSLASPDQSVRRAAAELPPRVPARNAAPLHGAEESPRLRFGPGWSSSRRLVAEAMRRTDLFRGLTGRAQPQVRPPKAVGTAQRKLVVHGVKADTEEADVQQLLAHLGQAAGIPLHWSPETGEVTLPENIDRVPDSSLARMLVIVCLDDKKTAQLLVGRNLPDVVFGSFPLESWSEGRPNAQSQVINLDHLEAVESAIQGLGVAIAAHETWENYIAQKYRAEGGHSAKDKGHRAGVKVESLIADELAGAGRRVSEDIEPNGDSQIVTPDKPEFNRRHFDNNCGYSRFPSLIQYERLTVTFDLLVQGGIYKVGDVRRLPRVARH